MPKKEVNKKKKIHENKRLEQLECLRIYMHSNSLLLWELKPKRFKSTRSNHLNM